MKKKILSLVLAATMGISMTACGSSDAGAAAQAAADAAGDAAEAVGKRRARCRRLWKRRQRL